MRPLAAAACLCAALLLAAPSVDAAQAAPQRSAQDDGQARIFRQMGLDPAPFIAEMIGLTLHLPESAHVQARQIGESVAYIIGDGPEPQYWRMQVEAVRLVQPAAADEQVVMPDVASFLDRILSRQTDYEVVQRLTPRYGGADGQLCYIRRTPPGSEPVINGWLVLPSGQASLIIISISVLPEVFDEFRPVFDRSFSTIRIRTEEQREHEQQSRIVNGHVLLASITPQRLRDLVGARQWFRTYRPGDGSPLGADQELACSVVEVLAAQRGQLDPSRDPEKFNALEQEEGLMVRVQGRIIVDPRRDMYYDTIASYWMSWDQTREAWSVLGTQRQGQASRTEAETGVRTSPSVASPIPRLTVIASDPTPYEWDVPETYLSQPLAWLLGRLLPRESTEPVFCTYYFYNARGRAPSLSLRYDRWEPLDDGSGHWQLATLLHKDQPPDISVYAADGSLIRRLRPNGDITEPTTREQLLRLWQSKGLRTGPASP